MHRRRQSSASRPTARRTGFVSAPRIRAGMLMTSHMDFAGLADVEDLMTAEGLTSAPMTAEDRPVERVVGPAHVTVSVLPTATVGDLGGGRLAGVVIPASSGPRSSEEGAMIDKVVTAAREARLPVMAFGDGVARALAAAGFEPPAATPAAILMHDGVLILETADDVRDALRVFVERPAARQAA